MFIEIEAKETEKVDGKELDYGATLYQAGCQINGSSLGEASKINVTVVKLLELENLNVPLSFLSLWFRRTIS